MNGTNIIDNGLLSLSIDSPFNPENSFLISANQAFLFDSSHSFFNHNLKFKKIK